MNMKQHFVKVRGKCVQTTCFNKRSKGRDRKRPELRRD